MVVNVVLSITLLLIGGHAYAEHTFLDIAALGQEQYQDIIINNEVVKPATGARRDCESRYTVIRTILDQYKRPFTMLDIGASQGYYSLRAAHDYNSVCVMIEGNNKAYPRIGDQLLDICKHNTKLSNIILLNRQIIPKDLTRLSECEHFDVVLALNIIHWFKKDWKQIINALVNMGDNIIVETPPQEGKKEQDIFRKQIEDYLVAQGGRVIAQVPRHTSRAMSNVYLIQRSGKYLKRTSWISGEDQDPKRYKVVSNFTEKKLVKKVKKSWEHVTVPWEPGINLMTYKFYSGTFPEKPKVVNEIKRLASTIECNDFLPNNFVMQGKRMTLIDRNEASHGPVRITPEQRVEKVIKAIEDDTFAWLFYVYSVGEKEREFFIKNFLTAHK